MGCNSSKSTDAVGAPPVDATPEECNDYADNMLATIAAAAKANPDNLMAKNFDKVRWNVVRGFRANLIPPCSK